MTTVKIQTKGQITLPKKIRDALDLKISDTLIIEEKNIKFVDAVIAYWFLSEGIDAIYIYDQKDFKRIAGLNVIHP